MCWQSTDYPKGPADGLSNRITCIDGMNYRLKRLTEGVQSVTEDELYVLSFLVACFTHLLQESDRRATCRIPAE
jgi:hypothetical protein